MWNRGFAAIIPGMGKRGPTPEYTERLPGARVPEGTSERLAAVLHSDEGKGEFLRTAILGEIERREADRKKRSDDAA